MDIIPGNKACASSDSTMWHMPISVKFVILHNAAWKKTFLYLRQSLKWPKNATPRVSTKAEY